MGCGLGRDHAFELAFAERFWVFQKTLGEGVTHKRSGSRPAGLEAHPKPDETTAREGTPIAREDFPSIKHHMQIHLAADAFETQPFFDGEQDLADAKEADDGDDKIESLHESGETEGHAQLAGDDVEADGSQNEPDHDRDYGFKGIAAAQPHKRGKSQ